MKKKILGFLLLAFSSFLLVACSSNDDLNGMVLITKVKRFWF